MPSRMPPAPGGIQNRENDPFYDPTPPAAPAEDVDALESGPAGPPIPEGPTPDIPAGPPSHVIPASPLALQGSFAQPGTEAARAFRTPAFLQNRVVGGDPLRFSSGTQIGASSISGESGRGPGREDEIVRAIVSSLQRR